MSGQNESIYVTRPSLPPLEEYVDEIRDMWETGILTHQGPKHNRLQAELGQYLDAPNITLFGNGHLAMELGLTALDLTGEVITTPFTFGSTTQAILRNRLKPVFCDIREDDFTIDADRIEELITDRTSAILPVHVYGNICDVEKIREIADRHHLKVLYDGAHAFGEKYKGESVGRFGDATMFSFHATKVFNTVEGGCLIYKEGNMREHLEGLRQFGQIVHTEKTPYVGTNAKMTDMHAAMGLCNLRHMEEYISRRQRVAEIYRSRLQGKAGIRLSVVQPDTESNYAYFPVVVEESRTGVSRDDVIAELEKHRVYVRKYFYPLCSDFEIIREMGIRSDVPTAKYVADRVITLPCYSDLDPADAERICDVIDSLYVRRNG